MPLSAQFDGFGVSPSVVSAVAVAPNLVQLTFSEVMLADAALSDPANYVLTPGMGSDPRSVLSVSPVGGSPLSVILNLDGDLTPGSSNYTITVADVTDAAANPLGTPDSATLSGPGAFLPLEVNSDGGEIVTINLGLVDGYYYVDVGLVPATSAVRAYSGVSGQGASCESLGGLLTFVVPRLAPAENYLALCTPVGGGAPILTSALFNARRRPIFSATHSLRRVMSPKMNVGPNVPELEVIP